jgi:hypothetical protein
MLGLTHTSPLLSGVQSRVVVVVVPGVVVVFVTVVVVGFTVVVVFVTVVVVGFTVVVVFIVVVVFTAFVAVVVLVVQPGGNGMLHKLEVFPL